MQNLRKKELMRNSNCDVLKEPVFIIGSPRSGTTFLGDILSRHPHLFYAIEPTPIWRYANERKSDLLTSEDCTSSIRKYIRNRFRKSILRNNKFRLLDKTPHNSLRIPFINSVFSDAQFVHILRDPYETILSIAKYWETNTKGFKDVRIYQRLGELAPRQIYYYGKEFVKRLFGVPVIWGPLLPNMDKLVREMTVLEISALQWKLCMENAKLHGRELGPSRYMEVNLENLDAGMLEDIMCFLGLPDHELIIKEFDQTYSKNRVSHRCAKADSELIREIDRILSGYKEFEV